MNPTDACVRIAQRRQQRRAQSQLAIRDALRGLARRSRQFPGCGFRLL